MGLIEGVAAATIRPGAEAVVMTGSN